MIGLLLPVWRGTLAHRHPAAHVDGKPAVGFAEPNGWCDVDGIDPPVALHDEREVFDFRYDPAEAKRLLDTAGFPDPDGDGPRPRLTLTLKTSTSEMYRIQAARFAK